MKTANSKKPAKTTARLRRPRGTREETREQLLLAAMDLLREGGAAAVTTTSVTQAIGLAQSGFYQHFSSVDECLQVAAERCGERIRQFVAEHLRVAQADKVDPITAHVRHFRAVLELCLHERSLAELLLRRRYDESPVGRAMGGLHDSLRDDLLGNLRDIAQSFHPRAADDPRLLVLVECLLAMTLAAGEIVLDGRGEVETLAGELAVYTYALCGNLAHRI